METLELAPLKGKKLSVLLVRKAYDEPWWVTSPPPADGDVLSPIIRRPSMAYCEMVKTLAEKEKPDFATDELGMRSPKEFTEANPLVDVLGKLKVPYRAVEMDEFARSYLANSIESKMEKRNEILDSLKVLTEKKVTSEIQLQIEELTAYGQYIHDELEDEIRQIEFSVRESWIAMGILKQAEEIEKKRIKAIHFCSPQHFQGLIDLLEMMEVNVTPITFKHVVEDIEGHEVKGITELTGISSVKVIPVIKKKKAKMQNILFFLEADEYASPFDICVAYDAGFDVVVPYPRVTNDNVTTLVQDAIFSRGTKGVKHTCFFLGGRDVPLARKMAKSVKKSMFNPFLTSVVVDPHGAFTTSAALVAKAEASLPALGFESLKGVNVLVVAGTGPVGESVAMLCAKAGANAVITSRKLKRAQDVAKRISTEEYTIKGVQAATPAEMKAALKKATLVFACGAPGIELVKEDHLKSVSANQILLDANAVPPPGIAELKASDDLRMLAPGKFGIGPLAVGDLKLKVQLQMLKEGLEKGEGVYDDVEALRIADEILEDQLASGKRKPVELLIKA